MKRLSKKTKRILISILVLLLIIRIALPYVILNRLNIYLAEFSPVYRLHIGDFSIHLWRTAYRFEDVDGVLKNPTAKNPAHFLKIESLDVSLAWRELFHGRVVSDIDIFGADLKASKGLFASPSVKDEKEIKGRINEAKSAKEKLFPIEVERLLVHNSTLVFGDSLDIPLAQSLIASNLEAAIINLTPMEKRPLTLISAKGTISNSSTLKVAGTLKMLKKPMDWDVDTEIRKYNLATANNILRQMIPITFKKGTLDLFAEAKSEDGHIIGYAKPLLKDVEVLGNNNDFIGIKHFFIELIAAVANSILKDPKTNTFATQFNFNNNSGKMKVDTSNAIDKAIDNGIGRPLKPEINNDIKLRDERIK